MAEPRTWTDCDHQPADRPPVVCDDGITAVYDPEDGWTRLELVHHPLQPNAPANGPAMVTGGETFMDWADLLDGYGPVREATDDEANTITERWLKPMEDR